MGKKDSATRNIRVTVRMTEKEYERLESLAQKWTNGNEGMLLRLFIWFVSIKNVKDERIKNMVEFSGYAVKPYHVD